MNILNLILAILLPPLGAFLQVGVSKHLIINLLLCLLGWVPGILHAVWLVATDQKG
ncbi:MAG: YqaE/Pmp3 family membrane protein [Sedimenticola sp.]